MGAMDSSILPVKSEIPLHNMDKVLAESSPAPWVIKAAGELQGILLHFVLETFSLEQLTYLRTYLLERNVTQKKKIITRGIQHSLNTCGDILV